LAAFERAGLAGRVGMARPREGLCSKRVLVMDRLHGTRMLDVMRTAREGRGHLPCPPEVVRVHGGWSGLVRSLHLAWGEMVLEEGVFHTDPHPGNLLLLDDGRLGILDWGQTKRLSPEHVTLICRLSLAMSAERYAQIEALIEGCGEFALEELEGRSALERRMAWVLICFTFVDTRWTPLSELTFADAPAGMLGKNRLSQNSKAFPLIRAVFLLRGIMASIGVSSSMVVAWEPIARRVLLQKGLAVEPLGRTVARRAALSSFWQVARWLLAAAQLTRGRPTHQPSTLEQKALATVAVPSGAELVPMAATASSARIDACATWPPRWLGAGMLLWGGNPPRAEGGGVCLRIRNVICCVM